MNLDFQIAIESIPYPLLFTIHVRKLKTTTTRIVTGFASESPSEKPLVSQPHLVSCSSLITSAETGSCQCSWLYHHQEW